VINPLLKSSQYEQSFGNFVFLKNENLVIMQNIKNIVFDLGGVILNIDAQLTFDAFKRLGMNGSFQDEKDAMKYFFDLEKGHSTPAAFRDFIRQLIGGQIADSDIDTAWTAMLLDIPADRVRYIEKLRRNYRVFLLSNTNEIHRLKFHRIFEENFGYSFDQLFERNHYSHEMGLRKPDPEIYRMVLKDNKLVPAETLFIDDIAENVVAAESVGMKGLNILPGTLLEALPDYLGEPIDSILVK
jgi:putative hydrolase of the HAD superfamily